MINNEAAQQSIKTTDGLELVLLSDFTVTNQPEAYTNPNMSPQHMVNNEATQQSMQATDEQSSEPIQSFDNQKLWTSTQNSYYWFQRGAFGL